MTVPAHKQLTPEERQTLIMIANGNTTDQIARAFYVTPEAIRFRVDRIFRKYGARNRAQAIRVGFQRGDILHTDIDLHRATPPPRQQIKRRNKPAPKKERPFSIGLEATMLMAVREYIEQSGLTHQQVASHCNISVNHVSHILNGRTRMSLAHAERMLAACGVEVTFRFTRVPKEQEAEQTA